MGGNYVDSDGHVRNLDGSLVPGEGYAYGAQPFNGSFVDSGGNIRNIDELGSSTNAKTYIYETPEQWEDGDAVAGLPSSTDLPVGATAIKAYEFKANQYIVSEYPDYAHPEATNYFDSVPITITTTAAYTWLFVDAFTAPKDGYYSYSFGGTKADTDIQMRISVNGFQTGYSRSAGAKCGLSDVLHLRQGDVVRVGAATATAGAVAIDIKISRYLPTLTNTTPVATAIIEPGSDLSTTEQPVLVWDNGTAKQKLDVNGDPIWERTILGTVTGAAGTWLSVPNDVTGIKRVLNYDGWWVMDPANPNQHGPIPVFRTANLTLANTYAFLPQISNGGALAISTASAYARTDSPYQLTIRYTKL
jgi:hypothetical protein